MRLLRDVFTLNFLFFLLGWLLLSFFQRRFGVIWLIHLDIVDFRRFSDLCLPFMLWILFIKTDSIRLSWVVSLLIRMLFGVFGLLVVGTLFQLRGCILLSGWIILSDLTDIFIAVKLSVPVLGLPRILGLTHFLLWLHLSLVWWLDLHLGFLGWSCFPNKRLIVRL